MKELELFDENEENPRPLSLLSAYELAKIASGEMVAFALTGIPDEEAIGNFIAAVLLRERCS